MAYVGYDVVCPDCGKVLKYGIDFGCNCKTKNKTEGSGKMAQEYSNDRQISLWYATDYETKEPKTDKNGNKYLTGSIEIDGKEFWINVYKNVSDNDRAPVMSGYLKDK